MDAAVDLRSPGVVRASLVLPSLLLLLACDTMHVGDPPQTEEPTAAPAPVEDPGDAPCETLTRAACLASVVCTLDAPASASPNRYTCREASGNCEVGLTQRARDRDRCEDRDGCTWRPGACYCACRGAGQTAVPDGPEAEDCDCECGGGPPPGCSPR